MRATMMTTTESWMIPEGSPNSASAAHVRHSFSPRLPPYFSLFVSPSLSCVCTCVCERVSVCVCVCVYAEGAGGVLSESAVEPGARCHGYNHAPSHNMQACPVGRARGECHKSSIRDILCLLLYSRETAIWVVAGLCGVLFTCQPCFIYFCTLLRTLYSAGLRS